jgi:hypothetical protein
VCVCVCVCMCVCVCVCVCVCLCVCVRRIANLFFWCCRSCLLGPQTSVPKVETMDLDSQTAAFLVSILTGDDQGSA